MKKSIVITGALASCAYMVLAASLAFGQGVLTQDEISLAAPDFAEQSAPIVEASTTPDAADNDGPSAVVARTQIALDRAGFSVGVIDGYEGDNYQRALAAFQSINNLELTGVLTPETWDMLSTSFGENAAVQYTITADDLATELIPEVPQDYAKMAELKAVSYTSVREMLAERFHMDEDFLAALNPAATFTTEGEIIVVADPMRPIREASVARIIVNAEYGRLHAYDKDGLLVADYPASVGSATTPSPSGTHEVRAVAVNPTYTYNPNVNFTQGDNTEVLTIPPGPNGPVGSIWIDLTKPTYGIHGTPNPSKIAKTQSHGCVRLTNWDAAELAKLVSPGTIVEFSKDS
ncbi:L,D-transpeptidase [Pararhizobium sp. IMCC21322]|uniref:L,D-transpeptidase family protein n=1 Tax=Pararhizobium sp. IMCC21322 TaxID=3067903 RepID=UPI0027408B94|nr:L,D-transpeptidase [Pararhizobium sp. IMCC21322]